MGRAMIEPRKATLRAQLAAVIAANERMAEALRGAVAPSRLWAMFVTGAVFGASMGWLALGLVLQ